MSDGKSTGMLGVRMLAGPEDSVDHRQDQGSVVRLERRGPQQGTLVTPRRAAAAEERLTGRKRPSAPSKNPQTEGAARGADRIQRDDAEGIHGAVRGRSWVLEWQVVCTSCLTEAAR